MTDTKPLSDDVKVNPYADFVQRIYEILMHDPGHFTGRGTDCVRMAQDIANALFPEIAAQQADIAALREKLRLHVLLQHVKPNGERNGGSCSICKMEWDEGDASAHTPDCILSQPSPGAALTAELEALRKRVAEVRKWAIEKYAKGSDPDKVDMHSCALCYSTWKPGDPERHEPGCPAAAVEDR